MSRYHENVKLEGNLHVCSIFDNRYYSRLYEHIYYLHLTGLPFYISLLPLQLYKDRHGRCLFFGDALLLVHA